MKRMQIVAAVVFTSAIPALGQTREAFPGQTCSTIQSSCINSCRVPRAGETCEQECLRYRNACLKTGVFQGRTQTITGLPRQ